MAKKSLIRVRLKNIVYKTEVISSGFGSVMSGQYKIGSVIDSNNRSVTVKFYDKELKEYYCEKYNTKTGVRIKDMGCPSGWRVNPKEWSRKHSVPASEKKKDSGHKLLKLHEEHIPFTSKNEYMTLQVWEDTQNGKRYLMPFRVIENIQKIKDPGGGTKTKRTCKQMAAMVPLRTIEKLLQMFN
jgi:hypothetical protein